MAKRKYAGSYGMRKRARAMAPIRKRRRSIRRYRRRRSFPTRVFNALRVISEKKRRDIQVFQQARLASNLPLVSYMASSLPNSTAQDGRLGARVTWTSLVARYNIRTTSPNDVPIYIDLYLAVHKNGAELLPSQLLEDFFDPDNEGVAQYTTSSYRNQDEFKEFIVMRKKRVVIRPTINAASNFATGWIKWKGRVTTTYVADQARINSWVVFAVCSRNVDSVNDPEMQLDMDSRMYFIDV